MNRTKLEKEGKKWVRDGLISEEQLANILAHYEKRDNSYLLVIFAALLVSIGVLIFIFSDWAQVAHLSRILMMLFFMLMLYVIGMYYYGREDTVKQGKYTRSQIIGISFIIIGYIIFGATLFLTIYIYDVHLQSVWPFVIWSFIGLLLYVLYPNPYLFTLGLLITIYGQLHSSLSLASFNYLIFLIFIVGYFHYVYHRGNAVYHYVFSIGLALQLYVLMINELEQIYWYILLVLIMYGLAQLMTPQFKHRMTQVAIFAIFIYKAFETSMIQAEYFQNELVIEPIFFVIWAIAFLIVGYLVYRDDRKELITLVLFLPFLFLPYGHFYIMITAFIYAIFWLIYGFQTKNESKVSLGIFSFLLSILIVVIQFTWETLNKSLFFLIAGILLFIISAIYERRRQKKNQGGDSI